MTDRRELVQDYTFPDHQRPAVLAGYRVFSVDDGRRLEIELIGVLGDVVHRLAFNVAFESGTGLEPNP